MTRAEVEFEFLNECYPKSRQLEKASYQYGFRRAVELAAGISRTYVQTFNGLQIAEAIEHMLEEGSAER